MKKSAILFRLAVLIIITSGCAKMGSLAGGAKDVAPPVLLSSKPLNYSTNFKSQKIELEFDEFIVLKNVNQELIISPPLPEKPEVKLKNKLLIIDLNNELRVNTTYTLNFGKAIVDNNEGNVLTNFEFVFSTGDFLDSLSVKGTILNSFNLQPSKEPLIIGLYDQHEDSVPLKNIPVYIGKSDDKGNFQINNIKSDTFKLFALKDLNYNLLFDLPNEEIAFIDTLLFITPEFLSSLPERVIKEDTIQADTVAPRVTPGIKKNRNQGAERDVPVAAAVPDSLVKKPVLPALFVDLFYFTEEATKQYMTDNERVGPESFRLSFSLPLRENPGTRLLDYDDTLNWYLPETSTARDTFTYWITDTTLMNRDTMRVEVSYPMKDSMGVAYTRLDTLKFITRKTAPVKQGRNKSPEKKPEVKLLVGTIRNNGLLDLDKNVPLLFNFPLRDTDTSLVRIYTLADSTRELQDYRIINDTSGIRKYFLLSDWKEKEKYSFQILPGAFTDIYGHTSDTMDVKFSVREKAYYGTLILTLSNVESNILVQLMNEKEQVLRTAVAGEDGEIRFEYLSPAKYRLKFVFDANSNGKWDTGNYLKNMQPEKVLYFKGEIGIRSNWDLEVKQDMGKP